MPSIQDHVGKRGEHIAATLLTRFHDRGAPFFDPQFLGDKRQTIDFMVELVGVDHPFVPFFFAQIKATHTGPTTGEKRISIRVSAEEIGRLLAYPAPTYLVGIDERRETGFIVASLVSRGQAVYSIPLRHSLDRVETLQTLYDEVRAFWLQYQPRFTRSSLM